MGRLWRDPTVLKKVLEGKGERFLGLFLRGCLELEEGRSAVLGLSTFFCRLFFLISHESFFFCCSVFSHFFPLKILNTPHHHPLQP